LLASSISNRPPNCRRPKKKSIGEKCGLKDLSEHFALGNISLTYEVASSKYAIKRPPMDYPLQVFTPVDLLDKRYLQNRKSLEKHLPFFEKSLPPGVQREWITDDIVLITWIQNAKNEDELIQQYYTKEDWMRENLELKLGSNWNIHGDKIMRRPNAITLDKEEDDVFLTAIMTFLIWV
jgi:hypothetical protein